MRGARPAAESVLGRGDFAARVAGIAVLGEPARRSLYLWVVVQGGPVTRYEAAEGVGVARHVAKFHLDRLVDEGLLDVDYMRPPGRRGPGAGRPAKRYRRASREVTVSLPERDYELAARLFARAITRSVETGGDVRDALNDAARDVGRELGRSAREHAGWRPSRSTRRVAMKDVLTQCGYEPRPDDSGVVLANCPFRAVAQNYAELVCGMNFEVMSGLVDELGPADLEAVLDPAPGRCCVQLRTEASSTSGQGGRV